MPRKLTSYSDVLTLILIFISFNIFTGCVTRIGDNGHKFLPSKDNVITLLDSNWTDKIDIIIPPSNLDMFECVKCHKGLKVNTKKRVLTGTHINFAFDHPGFDSENKWCYVCHYTLAFDSLRLETDKTVSYQKSFELCIQCHIKNYQFWAVGLHGRRAGMWNGEKQYLSCIYCHNAHTPKFKPIEPEKPPLKPVKDWL